MKRYVVAAALAAVLAACSESGKVYTVDEFLADDSLLDEYVAKCRNNPGALGSTPNCENADEASMKRASDQQMERLRQRIEQRQ